MEDIKSIEEKVEEKAEEKVEEKAEEKTEEKGIKVITKSGFEWNITAKMDDARLVDAIASTESGDKFEMLVAYKQIRVFLLGKKGTDALYAHIKKITGEDYVPMDMVKEELTEIFNFIKDQDEDIKN